ncbi:helix-turn-helix domain-containing protein [Streptomyces sp. AGS-58]|uniref:nSTAND1 domain-containing NTPase n=1 Tax=unclassified Streptomyces TaxID=2593676 RepID=UPI0035A26C77
MLMAGRPESPLDPNAGPVQRLAAELRKLRAEAGSPTYRVMAQRAGLGASTLSQAAAGERLPTLPVVLAYVRACGGDPEEWEERWRQAATEAAAAPRTEGEDTEPPYRGLARFEPTDADLFFGRDELTERLFQQACSRRFTAVFGPSGSGKSSLLRAGLIPRLRAPDQAGPRPAALRVLTPGEHPMRTHAERLAPTDGDGDTWLIVDQFEELYTLCTDPGEREQFLDHLLAATDPASRLRVVIAVRADFLGRCAAHPRLTTALQDATVLAGPMSRDELREAIIKPAQSVGLIVERALSARILEEVEGQPGALPMMSHALLETWRRRRGRALTLEAYEAAGGLHGAIARTAEDAHARLTPAQADLARRIVLRLITPGEGTPDTRRPVPRTELAFDSPTDTAVVLDRLARARLLTLDEDMVNIAHEALLTAWPRLRGWLEAERGRLRVHRQLTEAANTWRSLHEDAGVLYRGSRLTTAEEAFPEPDRPSFLTETEASFLAASISVRYKEQLAARRTVQRMRVLLAALAVLVLLAGSAAGVAFQQRGAAQRERDQALARQMVAEADRLSGRGGALQSQDASLAAQLELAAYRTHHAPQTYTDLVSLTTATLFSETPNDEPTPDKSGNSVPYNEGVSSDAAHGLMAVVGDDGRVRLWDTHDFAHPRRVGRPIVGTTVAFSPRGKMLAIADDTTNIRLLDTSDATSPRLLTTFSAPGPLGASTMTFSPDGRVLAGGTGDIFQRSHSGTFLWDLSNTAHPRLLDHHPLAGWVAAFQAHSPVLAVANGTNGSVDLWRVSGKGAPRYLGGFRTGALQVSHLTFTPDGRYVAADGSGRSQVWLWDVQDPRHPTRFKQPLSTPDGSQVNSAAFSPDGRVLALSGENGVQLWNVTSPDDPSRLGEPLGLQGRGLLGLVFSADGHALTTIGQTLRMWTLPPNVLVGCVGYSPPTVSPDGHTLAAVCDRHGDQVVLWDITSPFSPTRMRHPLPASLAVFAPRGHLLATADQEGAIALWNTAAGQTPTRYAQRRMSPDNAVDLMAISPDGRTLATGVGGDLNVQLWDISDPSRLRCRGVITPSEDGNYGLQGFSFSRTGHTLSITLTNDMSQDAAGEITFWNTANLAHAVRLGKPWPGEQMAFSRLGVAALVQADGAVRLWQVNHSGAKRPGALIATGSAPVTSIGFSSDGQRLAMGKEDGTLRLFDVSDLAHPRAVGNPVTGHTAAVRYVAFPETDVIVTGSDDDTVRFWDLNAARATRRICAVTDHSLGRRQWQEYVATSPYRPPCL